MPREFSVRSLYTVRAGDTLSAIAASHDCSLESLRLANAGLIGDPNAIQVGWELAIPGALGSDPKDPPAGEAVAEYVIISGDTLGALAQRWRCTVDAIASLNGIVNPSLIAVGQRLRIPDRATEEGGAIGGSGGSSTGGSVGGAVGGATLGTLPSRRLHFARMPLNMPPAFVTGGYREDYGGYLHRGIDIAGVPVGTPVFAPAGGIATVHRPGDGWGNGSFGICVILDHPGTPWWSIYAHLSVARVDTGQLVHVGELIGEVGFTGFVVPAGPAGAHLHWQLSNHPGFPPNFEFIANPMDFLQP